MDQLDEQDQDLTNELFGDPLADFNDACLTPPPSAAKRPAAWLDLDDCGNEEVDIHSKNRLRKLKTAFTEKKVSAQEFEERLRAQYEKLHPTQDWAKVSHKDSLEIFTSTASVVAEMQATILNPNRLEIVRLGDANQKQPSKVTFVYRIKYSHHYLSLSPSVQSVRFHPTLPLLLTAGFDKSLRIFQIDGKINPKLQSIVFKDMPIFSADFNLGNSSNDSNDLHSNDSKSPYGQIVLSGRRGFFYAYDLKNGYTEKIMGIRGRSEKSLEHLYSSKCGKYLAVLARDGYILLLSPQTKQWISSLKINGQVFDISFSTSNNQSQKNYLFAIGSDAEVYQFDLDSGECLHRFHDHGCVKATKICVSPDYNWIATGSSTGVVNIYRMTDALASEKPLPAKEVMSLTSPISSLRFHPSSQLLAIASKEQKDAFRLVHTPSLNVVKNWPTSSTPLGYVSDVDFSSDGKMVAIGNAKGKVLLYRFVAF